MNTRLILRLALWTLIVSAHCTESFSASLHVKVQSATGALLPDSIVYLTPVSPVPATAPLQAKIDQVHKMFVPRTSVVQVGTAVSFPNSDNIRHSIYSFSPAKVFTLKLYSGTPSTPVVFDKTGVVVLGCNIHDQMVAWLLVIDTPYSQRTDAEGAASFANVPAGDYVLRAWHEPMSEEAAGEPMHLEASSAQSRTLQLDIDAQPSTMPGMDR